MPNTHYDNVMNILMAVSDGSMEINAAMAEVHQHVKEELPQHGPQPIIVIGTAGVHYDNGSLEKNIQGDYILVARPKDGSIVVLPLNFGVKPVAYITQGASLQIEEDFTSFLATTDDGQVLHVQFTHVQYTSGV